MLTVEYIDYQKEGEGNRQSYTEIDRRTIDVKNLKSIQGPGISGEALRELKAGNVIEIDLGALGIQANTVRRIGVYPKGQRKTPVKRKQTRFERLKNWLCFKIAGLMPNRLMYFIVVAVWARMTTTKAHHHKTPDECTWSEACRFLGNY